MAELYAGKWERDNGRVGGETFLAWQRELAGVPLLGIKHALDTIREVKPEWPPSLITFLRLCEPEQRPNEEMYLTDEQKGRKRLPGKTPAQRCAEKDLEERYGIKS